jgi:hypothetical protein
MRGCLWILVLAASLLGATVWFGGPPLAAAVVRTSLGGSGLVADRLDVTVSADPPLTLALGRASSVTIVASGVTWNDVRLDSLDLTLGSVDLVARTAATVAGHFGGVQLSGRGGARVTADVELSGPAGAARTTIGIDAASFDTLALGAFEAEFGVRPSSVQLAEPDVVNVALGGLTVSGRLAVATDGSIVTEANGATVRLVAADQSLPLRLSGLAVVGDGLELTGAMDVSSLLR